MRRVSVVGNSGSGKSTLSAALAERLGVPYTELDGLFHQAGWTELAIDEFRRQVAELVAGDGWVIDGNYSRVRDLVWARADTVVWLDLARSLVTRRIVLRTLGRVLRRRELWNGNREHWRDQLSLDPPRSVIGSSWTQHTRYRDQYVAATADPAHASLRFVRLTTPRDVTIFLAGNSGRRGWPEGYAYPAIREWAERVCDGLIRCCGGRCRGR